jgi:hypothetical protein
MSISFRSYLRQWFDAAVRPAYDTYGWVSGAIGFALWLCHKYWPKQFKWAADQVGVPAEVAMSDLVWIVPLGFGFLVLAYRLLRAPYEIHDAQTQASQKTEADLRARIADLERGEIDVKSGGYYISASTPGESCAYPGVWVIYYDLVITNRTDRHLPLELWLMVGTKPDGSSRFGDTAQNGIGGWALQSFVESETPFSRVVNLPARSTESGFCFTNLTHEILKMANVANEKELAESRPFWLDIRNMLTGESKSYPINYLARRADRAMAEEQNA